MGPPSRPTYGRQWQGGTPVETKQNGKGRGDREAVSHKPGPSGGEESAQAHERAATRQSFQPSSTPLPCPPHPSQRRIRFHGMQK